MNFLEIKRWAKDQGFSVTKEKDNSTNGASYYWMNNTNNSISGISLSVSKLARDIFNSISDNKWLEHQKEYQENKETKKFTVSEYN